MVAGGVSANSGGYPRDNGLSVRCLKNPLPHVNTTSVIYYTHSTALLEGEVISDGSEQNTTRGFCYSSIPNPTILNDTTLNGIGIGVYTGTIQNLNSSTIYYVRAYAKNSVGTAYGNELNFTTDSIFIPGVRCPGTPSVTDIDGNLYHTVQIGNQCWTQSNLKVTKYRNGDNIPTGLSNSNWGSTFSGAYVSYLNSTFNDSLFGKLYNWYAVGDGRGICPIGWHVPSNSEWTTLTDFLGGESVAGGALKNTSTQPIPGGWNVPNTGATNSSGFTALPGGWRDDGGAFRDLNNNGRWWSSSVYTGVSNTSWYRSMVAGGVSANSGGYPRDNGLSVRCLRD
jgi:uncharacterized protein (TIGR02145 family)